ESARGAIVVPNKKGRQGDTEDTMGGRSWEPRCSLGHTSKSTQGGKGSRKHPLCRATLRCRRVLAAIPLSIFPASFTSIPCPSAGEQSVPTARTGLCRRRARSER